MDESTEPIAVVTARGADRVRAGHPWIYRSDVARCRAEGGDTVRVIGPRARPIGTALFSDRSQIALRLLTRGSEPVDASFWRSRLAEAVAYRAALEIDADCYRLVHGEADRLPSLIVDRYGDYLVVQALSQGVDRLMPLLASLLLDLCGPRGILARNDPRVRLLEGLERRVELLHGDVPDVVEVREGPVRYLADLWSGQKTGLFLDQRENREAAARYARGRVLDAFSYHGGFALRLASRAASVLALESSASAGARLEENARLNGLSSVEIRTVNVFDELRALERGGATFDTIVLDPPAFAKSRHALERALPGYKEINLRALRLLQPGGFLVTCSCSQAVDEATFGEIVGEAAHDAGAMVTLVEKRLQGRDHPVLLGVPETCYMKCFILRRLP